MIKTNENKTEKSLSLVVLIIDRSLGVLSCDRLLRDWDVISVAVCGLFSITADSELL